ncbi:MAG: M43 family zinc metalloprotease [Bacteroidota bacterium]|nr:M43 family zinc metalloprotease [Bacteroidota bacterium]
MYSIITNKFFYLKVLIFIGTLNLIAQNRIPSIYVNDLPVNRVCHTMQLDSIRRSKYNLPSLLDEEKNFQKNIARFEAMRKGSRTTTDTTYIPVIVHVVHNGEAVGTGTNISEAQIQSQFDALNEDFNKIINTNGYNTNPVGAVMFIKFVRATIDLQGKILAEAGVHRYNGGRTAWSITNVENSLKPTTIWDPTKYLNIWTVRFSGTDATTLGYAQLPNLSQLDGLDPVEGGATTDGLVIRFNVFGRTSNINPPYNLGRTATHEMGHIFGLRHIWGDLSNCTGTDYCNDTPPTSDPIYGCPSSYASCTAGVQAMYQNYMDYADDRCMNIFTNDQKTRILTVLQNSPRRKELPNSNVYVVSSVPSADFSVSQQSACVGNVITFTDKSSRNPTSRIWTITNSNKQVVTTSSLNTFTYAFSNIGNYTVQIIATNTFGSDTLVRQNYISILSSNQASMPFLADMESSSTVLGNWLFYTPENVKPWTYSSQASGFGTGSRSIICNNYDSTYDQTDKESGIISPKFNFTGGANAYLSFNVAYTPYKSSSTSFPEYYYDTLNIYYSTNCGQTKTSLWKKGGINLSTAPPTYQSFVPTSSQWRTEQISLAFLNGQSNLQFYFINKSGWGNVLYLDNINIQMPNRTTVPASNFSTNPQVACSGDNIALSDQSSQYPTSWKWAINDVSNVLSPLTSSGQNIVAILYTAGTYNVSLTASNSLGTGNTLTKTNNIVIYPKPTLTLSANLKDGLAKCGQVITLTVSGATNYQWFNSRSFGEISSSNSNIITDTVNYTSTYSVVGIDSKGCKNVVSLSVPVENSGCLTGIENSIELPNSMEIYPNPNNGKFKVNSHTRNKLVIIDLMGNIVFEQIIEPGIIEMDTHLIPGLYYYYTGTKRGKIIIE